MSGDMEMKYTFFVDDLTGLALGLVIVFSGLYLSMIPEFYNMSLVLVIFGIIYFLTTLGVETKK